MTPAQSHLEPKEPTMTSTRATTGHRPSQDPPATRSPAHDARAVLSALRSERIKASTVRANAGILVFTLIGGLLVSWAVGAFVTDEVLVVAQLGFTWTSVTGMLAAIGG